MHGNSNNNRQSESPINNVREKKAISFKTFLIFAAAAAAAVLLSVLTKPISRNAEAKKTQQETATASKENIEAVLDKKCQQNCGITCIKGVCTVERKYPMTDIAKKTFYSAEGKPERMEYCIKKDRYGLCVRGGTAYYRPDGKITLLMKCISYDANGICTRQGEISNYFYDEKGNNVLKKNCTDSECRQPAYMAYAYNEHGDITADGIPCSNYKNGKCGSFGPGPVFEYDDKGRKTSARACTEFNIDLSCAEYSTDGGYNYKYDEDGNCIYAELCTETNAKTGICTKAASAQYYKYSGKKEPESYVYCINPDGKGSCESKKEFIYSREYDEHGNVLKTLEYTIQKSSGTSGETKKLSSIQKYYTAYNRLGQKTHVKRDICQKPDENGNCISGWLFTETDIDENDKILRRKLCAKVSESGGCIKEIPAAVSLYDDNGTFIDKSDGPVNISIWWTLLQ